MQCYDTMKEQYLEFDGPVYIMLPTLHELVQTTEPLDKVDYQKGFKDSWSLLADKYNT